MAGAWTWPLTPVSSACLLPGGSDLSAGIHSATEFSKVNRSFKIAEQNLQFPMVVKKTSQCVHAETVSCAWSSCNAPVLSRAAHTVGYRDVTALASMRRSDTGATAVLLGEGLGEEEMWCIGTENQSKQLPKGSPGAPNTGTCFYSPTALSCAKLLLTGAKIS